MTIHDLTCVSSTGNQYILGTKSGVELFPGIIVNSYTCIEIRTTSFSPSKYEFYFVTGIDVATDEPFTSDVNVVCDGTATETGANINIVIADGTQVEALKETLPDLIRGDYRVTITDQNGITGNETLLTSCNDTSAFYVTEIENTTQTVGAVAFSDSGVLYNMKSLTRSGITYIITYNTDSTVNSFSTYKFACWAMAQDPSSSTVYATVFQEVCHADQNTTYVPSGGQVLVLIPSVTCVDTTTSGGLSPAIITVIVLVCVLAVIAITIAVYFIRKKQRKDISKPLPKNTKEETDGPSTRKGTKRPKSSNDLDSARLIEERNKQKLAKKMAKKKETRTIAVQASIWTAPIKRTTTALKEKLKRSNSQGSVKFIPYVDKPVIITHPAKTATRSNTTLESKNQAIDHGEPMPRSNTTVERKDKKPVPKYLLKHRHTISPRQKLIKQISEIDTHTSDHYSNQFEKLFPFPNEGNPNSFHNTLDIQDETGDGETEENDTKENKELKEYKELKENKDPKGSKETSIVVEEEKEQPNGKASAEVKENIQNREYTKTSLRSRPSTAVGILGVNLNRSGSVRKTNSEQMERTKAIMKFSYNSPYALSKAQKEYLSKKANWIHSQVQKDKQSKKHIEEMKRLESQRAFDAWVKNKRKCAKTLRRKISRISKTSKTSNSTSMSLIQSTSSS